MSARLQHPPHFIQGPRRIFDRLFSGDRESLTSERAALARRIKLVDAGAESARSLNQQLGQSDRARMDQYLTSLNEVESRLIASEKWINVPLKVQVPIHTTYITAWANRQGSVSFRDDVYNFDAQGTVTFTDT